MLGCLSSTSEFAQFYCRVSDSFKALYLGILFCCGSQANLIYIQDLNFKDITWKQTVFSNIYYSYEKLFISIQICLKTKFKYI